MTPNRRIFLNIVATYGRSLYAPIGNQENDMNGTSRPRYTNARNAQIAA